MTLWDRVIGLFAIGQCLTYQGLILLGGIPSHEPRYLVWMAVVGWLASAVRFATAP